MSLRAVVMTDIGGLAMASVSPVIPAAKQGLRAGFPGSPHTPVRKRNHVLDF